MFHSMDRRALRLRACLEALEDRRLLSAYTATELEGLSVSRLFIEGGLSNNGSVVAFHNQSQTSAVRHKSGALTPVNAGVQTRANDLSESGIVVGTFGGGRAFMWQDGVATELPGLGGGESVANAVNNDGEVAGYSRHPDGFTRGIIWRDGVAEVLPTLGGSFSIANDINNLGVVVGESSASGNFPPFAFIYQDGQMTNLGTLRPGLFSFSNALAVNDVNQVVGGSFDFVNGMEAFIWSDGQMTGLGTLGGNYSLANDINNDGVVVGQSRTAEGALAGFVWTAEGGMVDLNSYFGGTVGHIGNAINVNERGQILAVVGNGLYLLTPTDDAAVVSPPEVADDSLGESDVEESEEVSLLA